MPSNVYSVQYLSFSQVALRPVSGDYLNLDHFGRNGRDKFIFMLSSQLKETYQIIPNLAQSVKAFKLAVWQHERFRIRVTGKGMLHCPR
jgi:hypothetical protein